MADIFTDEDGPIPNLRGKGDSQEHDPSDEVQDFRFLAAIGSGQGHKIPKRGEKDFELNGTRHQESVLEASRMAMHEALDYTRVHPPKSARRAWYVGEEVLDEYEADADIDVLSETIRGKGLERDHVVMVENSKGAHFRTIGKPARGTSEAKVWLLPEEALYLIERGNLDLWWPSKPLRAITGPVAKQKAKSSDEESEDDGVPLSLQAAYALLIGDDGERGKVSLERYTVYANLKRAGYVVFRPAGLCGSDSGGGNSGGSLPEKRSSLFNFLFGRVFDGWSQQHSPNGPLVRPGLYRSYNQIYQRLSIVPRHTPSPKPSSSCTSPNSPFQVSFYAWKPSRIPGFAKSNPGRPDFRIAVVSSQSTTIPTLTEMTSLLESTPWDPPSQEWTGPEKCYARLKHGFRNVILAVADRGVISYLRVGEAAFGNEKLYESFDRGSIGRPKKGGGRGGRQGRGGGRGRGR